MLDIRVISFSFKKSVQIYTRVLDARPPTVEYLLESGEPPMIQEPR